MTSVSEGAFAFLFKSIDTNGKGVFIRFVMDSSKICDWQEILCVNGDSEPQLLSDLNQIVCVLFSRLLTIVLCLPHCAQMGET